MGEKTILADFSFGMGHKERGLMTMGRFLGESVSFLSGFDVKKTTYKLIQHGDLV